MTNHQKIYYIYVKKDNYDKAVHIMNS